MSGKFEASAGYFPGKVGLQQRVLPGYRALFLDTLAEACREGLSVYAGKPRPEESIAAVDHLEVACYEYGRNLQFVQLNSPLYILWQSGLLDWLRNWNPDVLIAEANQRYASTWSAIRWMHARGRPVIGWGLGAPDFTGQSKEQGFLSSYLRRSRQRFIQSFDALIAYSQTGAVEYAGLGFPTDRIFVAHNAVTPRPAGQIPERPEGFAERPRVLFAGRLQARKRIDNLLKACAALPENMQPNLWIVGDGPSRTAFEHLSKEIYPRAKFLGACFGDELESLFLKADLFVLPGTGGLAVQQAMAHGLPVVVAQGDGTQQDLVSQQNGWLIPRDSLDSLITALREALSNPLRLRRMGAESFKIVSEEANIEGMVESFLRALKAVAGRS